MRLACNSDPWGVFSMKLELLVIIGKTDFIFQILRHLLGLASWRAGVGSLTSV